MDFNAKSITTTPPPRIIVSTTFSNSSSPSSSASPTPIPSPQYSPTAIPSPSHKFSPVGQSMSPPPPPPPPVVVSPCAACKILRRRCVDKCVLAPYFPPTDPLKFTIAHRVFGASNIIKFLQEIPEGQRSDAVSSMVYEANARIRDPVYGCAGAICQLQKQISELQGQLAKAQAELVNMQCHHKNLIALICMDVTSQSPTLQQQVPCVDTTCFLDDTVFGTGWEPLWT